MTITLPLETMTVADKIKAMESIWQSFLKNTASMVLPSWHRDVLAARKARASNGTSQYDDWEKAKRRIRAAVQS